MGLHTDYEIFRRRLAALGGIDLKAMPGYDPRSRLAGRLPQPLEELFRSSSVHGYWTGQCRRMLPKLRARP